MGGKNAFTLTEAYGIGATLVKKWGWTPGKGIGKNLEGKLEPVSLQILRDVAVHHGKKDRRCLGVQPLKNVFDSDATQSVNSADEESSSESSRSRRHNRRSKVRLKSSPSKSRSRSGRRKKKRRAKS